MQACNDLVSSVKAKQFRTRLVLTQRCKNISAVAIGGGGGVKGRQLPPLDLLNQTHQVCGWICFL